MSIQFFCPHGHLLRVKDSFAGRKGFCPACKAPIQVPTPSSDEMEDEVLQIIGPHNPDSSEMPLEPLAESLEHLRRSSATPYKSCVRCHREIMSATRVCPFCHTYVAELADF